MLMQNIITTKILPHRVSNLHLFFVFMFLIEDENGQ